MMLASAIAIALLSSVVIFQIALTLGAPWGRVAWGGQHEGVLPRRLRIASGITAFVVYPLIILTVLDADGALDWGPLPADNASLMWGFAALFAVGAAANLISRSPLERLWSPVSLGIAVCCAVIARGL
jgi:hypothetical protein